MNQRTIIIIAVLAVAVAALWWWNKRKKAQSTIDTAPLFTASPTVVAKSVTPLVPQPAATVTPSSITVAPGKVLGGYNVYSKGTNVRKEPTTSSKIVATVANGALIGTTTGESKTYMDGVWVKVFNSKTGMTGWVRSDVVRITAPGTAGLNGHRRTRL